jgi:peptide/nickel transport system substrate-binding protein
MTFSHSVFYFVRLIFLVGFIVLLTACRSSAEVSTATPAATTATAVPFIPATVTAIIDTTNPAAAGATAVAIVTATAVATNTPTAPPEPMSKTIVVCMGVEPADLYLYGSSSPAKTAIFHALYENLFTNLTYSYQAQGLAKLPDFAGNDVELQQTAVKVGDLIVDARGNVVQLQAGVLVRTAGGEVERFAGESSIMEQMVVRFRLRPLVWSDGVPVKAADSVFSFQLAAHPQTAGSKLRIERTASYIAEDDQTIVWTGLPGWRDTLYFTNIWTPLPSHQLQPYSAQQLLIAPETARQPLSNGPFVVEEWSAGSHMRLARNPHYYRAAEGLPRLDSVTIRFQPNSDQVKADLLAGRCDVATGDSVNIADLPALLAEAEAGRLRVQTQPDAIFEHIAFGIGPVEEYAATRPAWFADVRVRQAMVMCTDRQRMVDELLYGRSTVMHAYISALHPLFPADAALWPYDVDAANALLDEAGFRRDPEDGIRRWPRRDIPFQVRLGASAGGEFRPRLNAIFQENMADCGITIETYEEPAGQWFAPGPAGTIFGRRFDLATFAWLATAVPACHLYQTEMIPGGLPEHSRGWEGQNVTGWSNELFDELCQAAATAFFDTPEYQQAHQAAIRLFVEQVPVIPLLPRLKLAVTTTAVANFQLDPSQPSELWNLFAWDVDR